MTSTEVRGKILVTGGAGFIGSRLVQALLKRGLKVRVLDVHQGPLREKTGSLEFVGLSADEKGGMLNRDVVRAAVKDVEVIYHLAINWDGNSWRHQNPIADLFDTNIRGTLNLLEKAKSEKVRHFIFASSEAVYGTESREIVNEETVCKPEVWIGDPGPAYGIVKLATEKVCLMFHHHFGLPVTVFRIAVVFNDEEELYVSREMVERVRKGDTDELGGNEVSTGIHVDEVVDAFLRSTVNRKSYGQIFNLANPATRISNYELYQLLAQLVDSKLKVKPTKASARGGISIERTGRLLGWKPWKTIEDRKKAIATTVQAMVA